MKRLGTVKNVMRDGSILLRASLELKPGVAVYDARGKRIGHVSRVFGPADKPYITMKTDLASTKTLNLLETTAFFDPCGTENGSKKRG